MKKYQTPEYELCLVDTTDIMNDSPTQGGLILGDDNSAPEDIFWDQV